MINGISSELPIENGHLVNFSNYNEYAKKHNNGHLKAFNVICYKNENETKFFGFGLNLNGVSREEICQELLDGYNQQPIDEEIEIESDRGNYYLKIFNEFKQEMPNLNDSDIIEYTDYYLKGIKIKQITRNEFNHNGGGKIQSIYEINKNFLSKVIHATPEQATRMVNDNNAANIP